MQGDTIERRWTLCQADTTAERARKLAEMAFADFANDRLGMTAKAALRIANALEHYARMDAAAKGVVETPGHE